MAPGDGVLVLGFVVVGEGEIRLLLRALGPRPVPTGPQPVQPSDPTGAVPLPPADPAIELYRGSTLIAENDSWRSDERSATEIREAAAALGTPLGDDVNAGLVVTLRPGAYTLQVRDRTGGTGLVLAEICELPPVVSAVAQPGGGTGTAGTATVRDFDPADAVNAVGLGIYRRLAAESSAANVAIAPYSIQTALALAYMGAAGDTRREMAEVLRFPDDNAILQAGFATVRDAMSAVVEESRKTAATRTAGGKPTRPIEWHAANRLYGQTGYGFRDSFLTLLRDGFGAPLVELDFRQQPEAARLTINAWVREATQQKIVDVIPGGGLDASTRLVLVNAIYLNAPWDTPFKRENTVPRPFNLTPDNRVNVPTMGETVGGGYSVEDGFAVAGVDYLGRGLRFLILLPNANESVETVAARLTPTHFARWSRLGPAEVTLYLPKFKIAGSTVSLADTLRAMGMRTAFAAGANFDGRAPRTIEPLGIQDVFHQAFVALDEEGTEAAAATAVSVTPVSAPLLRVEVHVDRPFLFAIQDRATGTCLFLGRISDPR